MSATHTRGLLALAALALAFTGQYFIEHVGALAIGLLLFAAGGVALVAARPNEPSLFTREPFAPVVTDTGREKRRPPRVLQALLAALPLLGLSLYRSRSNPDDALAWAFHAASVIAFLYVLLRPSPAAILDRLRRARPRPAAASRLEIVAVASILVLALLLRTVALESLPFGLWFDEGVHGMRAVEMLDDSSYRPIFVPAANLASPFIAVQAASVAFLGRTAVAVRLPSALLDVGFILLLYMLARSLLGWRTALVVAFLVAVSSWDITWGRSGMPGVTAPLLGVAAVIAFLWALRRNEGVAFALAGMALGSGLWIYQAFRTIPAALALIAAYAFVTYRPPGRETAVRIAAYAVGALLIAAPLLQYSVTHTEEFWKRAVIVTSLNQGPSVDPVASIWPNLDDYLLMFNYRGDFNGRHNLPFEPMLSFGAGAMALLGFLYCLSRPHRPVPFLLLAWFFFALLPGLITLPFEAPNSLRVVGALPVVYMFAGVGIAAVGTGAAPLLPKPRHAAIVLGVPLALGLGATAYDNFHTYFHLYRDSFEAWVSFNPEQTEVAHRLRDLPSPDYDVVLSPHMPYYPVISYLVHDPPRVEAFVPARHPPASGDGEGALIFLDTRQGQYMQRFSEFYPGRSFTQVDFGKGPLQPILYSMELDALDTFASQGVTLRMSSQGAGQQTITEDRVSRIDLPWDELAPRMPFTAEWTGTLYVGDYETYKLTLEGSPDVTLRIDGAVLIDGPGEVEVPLAVGFHDLRLQDVVRDTDGRTRLTWVHPEGDPTVVGTPNLYAGERSHGLLGTYLPPGFPENLSDVFQQIDPMIFFFYHKRPFSGEFSVRWDGGLRIDEAGDYGFTLDSSGPATLVVGGAAVVDNPGIAAAGAGEFESSSGSVTLEAGLHPVSVTFQHRLGSPQIYMYWWSERESAAPVPWDRLIPAPPMPPN